MGEAITTAGSPSARSAPLCSTTMRSDSSRTTSILCSTRRIVLSRWALSERIRSRMTGTSSTLMPAVGSSNMKTSGSSAIRIATSSLRWSPWGSAAAATSRRAVSATVSSTSSARPISSLWLLQTLHRFSPRPARDCTSRRTFSSTVRFGNRFVNWKARPMPRWLRSGAEIALMSSPWRNTRPDVARSWPEIRLKYVVLPAPLGPTIAVRVPAANPHGTLSTATWLPNRMVRSRVSREKFIGSRRRFRRSGRAPAARTGARPVPGILALVPDRNVHVLDLDLADELGDRPGHVRVDLDLEVIHGLKGLVVFLAEDHLPLRRLEGHAFHRGDQLFGVGGPARLLRRTHDGEAGGHAPRREEVGGRLEPLLVLRHEPLVDRVLRNVVVVIGGALHAGEGLVRRERRQDVAAGRDLDAVALRVEVGDLEGVSGAGPVDEDDLPALLVLERVEEALRAGREVGRVRRQVLLVDERRVLQGALERRDEVAAERVVLRERRDVHAGLVEGDGVRDRVLRGIPAGPEDVAVPLVAGDRVGHGRLDDEDLLVLLGHRQHRERDARARRPDSEVGLVVREGRRELGLAHVGLALAVLLDHDQLVAVDHHRAAGPVFQTHHQTGLGLLGIGLERPRLVVDVGDLDVLRHGGSRAEGSAVKQAPSVRATPG